MYSKRIKDFKKFVSLKALGIFLIVLVWGCAKNATSSNEWIEVYYMRPYVSTPFSYPCGMISKAALKDEIHVKEFKDTATINQIIKMYNNYEIEPNPDEQLDARIKLIIKTEQMNDTICLGENAYTFINGVKYKDNQEMLDFIKKIIDYENTPRPTFPKSKY
jgi:hypothetical protein